MLPIVDANLWSGLASRIQFSVRDGVMSATTLDDASRVFSNGHHAQEINAGSIESKTGVMYALILLSLFLFFLYGKVLVSMAQQWLSDPNYGHGFLVPLFAAYILWRERGLRREVSVRTSNWGLVIMLFALGLLILGTLGSEHFTARISFLIMIAGIGVFLVGWQALRSVAFPLGYLVLMIPLPAVIYYQLTFPLQLLASRLGADGLVALGVPTVREGNLLILPNCTLEVVEACSGVRSLLSLVAVVVGYVYLAEPTAWKRGVLVAAAIPVVIMSNAFRLIATGILSFFWDPAADAGVVHTGLGLVFFLLAFLSILLIHGVLRRFNVNHVPVSEEPCRF